MILLALLLFQQVPDRDFQIQAGPPKWKEGRGPALAIDEAHHNFHTATGRYSTFATLARRDGFIVRENKQRFSADSLRGIRILVIANALHESNADSWKPPNDPAFTDDEVQAVKSWVSGGGSLFLIADHQPFPAAASTLAAAFGIEVHNGYAFDQEPLTGMLRFKLPEGPVLTFGGSALTLPEGAEPILPLSPKAESRIVPNPGTANLGRPIEVKSVAGWSQGGLLRFGKGRVAMFGEAAMFSAQLAGPNKLPMGMNHPDAAGNSKLLLRILRWLADTE